MSDLIESAVVAEEPAVDTALLGSEDSTPEGSQEVTTPSVDHSGITIKYNHQLRDLTAEEAKNYAQMGVRYESLTPMLDKLKAVAAYNGKTVDEIVNALAEKDDADMRQKILDECKGDQALADRLIEVERNKRGAAFKSAQENEAKAEADEETNLHKRLADEFVALQKEFPDIAEIASLPRSVVEESVKGSKTLADAYIIHLHRQERNKAKAESAAASASKASTGSAGSEAENTNTVVDAFKKAFRS